MSLYNRIIVFEKNIYDLLLEIDPEYNVLHFETFDDLKSGEYFSTIVLHIDSKEKYNEYRKIVNYKYYSVIILSEYPLEYYDISDVSNTITAVLRYPVSDIEFKIAVKHSFERVNDLFEKDRLQKLAEETYNFENIIGVSPPMQKIYSLIDKVSSHDVTVMILGESGTGKELVANAIHYNSDRKNNPFIAVNCAALSESLLESELFGHVKGAFTGAHKDHIGKFQSSDTGTIFLDEVAEMSLITQTKLLRVLQEKIIEPVGSEKKIKVDVRIISATNKDLKKEISEGRFREDLYFRLNVINIELPPLRKRKEDIYILVSHFLEKFNKKFQTVFEELDYEAIEKLMNYDWPGNVRELENTIERACILGSGNVICSDDIALPGQNKEINLNNLSDVFDNFTSLKQAKEFFEKKYLEYMLIFNKWNISKTAKKLKIQRISIYKKMRKFNIKR